MVERVTAFQVLKSKGGAEEGERDRNFLPCSPQLSQSRDV